jgi:hypothetical protein
VRTIVRKNGGSIQVNSRPGDTRFQVWFPCAGPPNLSCLAIARRPSPVSKVVPCVDTAGTGGRRFV